MEDEKIVMMSSKGYQQLIGSEDGKNLYWTTDINVELPVKIRHSGKGSEAPTTVSQLFRRTARVFGDQNALFVERDNKVLKWTWEEFSRDVDAFARAMVSVGITERKSVNIMGHNAPEWFISFIGATHANCVTSGVYPTNNAEACYYQADHSEAELIVVDSVEQMRKYEQNFHKLPNIKAIVIYNLEKLPSDVKDKRVYVWREFLTLGKDVKQDIINERIAKQRPGMCATLIYTSGTTGNPKACMLSHDSLTWTPQAVADQMMGGQVSFNHEDRVVSYLPLSHIAGLTFDLFTSICFGGKVYFARPDALQGTLVQTLQWARPTAFLAVPRVWEKMEDKLKELGASKGALLQKISGWAKGLGAAKVEAQAKQQGPPMCYSIANALILSKIKSALGLDKAKIFLTGAAPIKATTVDYFASLDIPIFGAYGMSETTAMMSILSLGKFNLRSCGLPINGAEVKLENPDEKGVGEIVIRGRTNMMGYLKNEQATKETIDPQGFLHSGDLGRIDENGFLFITGRIKELIITAGGENIAPLIIEDYFKEFCPPCSNIMVIGENQKFLGAFITFKVDIDPTKGVPSYNLTNEAKNFFKQSLNLDLKTTQEAISNDAVRKYIQQCIDKTNAKAVSRAAHVRKWEILPDDFSLPGGELTPTLKLKRKVTEKKYQKLVDEFYSDAKL